jgi:hypothetical protein
MHTLDNVLFLPKVVEKVHDRGWLSLEMEADPERPGMLRYVLRTRLWPPPARV